MAETSAQPDLWMLAPFVLLLGCIALGPVLFPDRWGRHYGKVAFSLGGFVLAVYLLRLHAGATVWHTAREYLSFIALIGSLFVVSGGIHINVKGESTPLANVVFLAIGALVANLLGTTGASMLLIRPWLRMNRYRVTGYHVVFFIFIVSNVGGCLTPIGDPPLFLGYLKGIPFWWVTRACWPIWLISIAYLLLAFAILDWRNYLRAPKAVRATLAEPPDTWRFQGLSNLLFLGVVVASVFVDRPMFVRETLMATAACGSYFTTSSTVHDANHFSFAPIEEVAILFFGIFATMMPALDWLQFNAQHLGPPTLSMFYWGSGLLSSVLDNAPTYLTFLKAAAATLVPSDLVAEVQQFLHSAPAPSAPISDAARSTIELLRHAHSGASTPSALDPDLIQVAFLVSHAKLGNYIAAISIGAVFFGANTYIGNGPNFMVKAIAQHQKAHTPTFLRYILSYSVPILGPLLLLIWWVFFRTWE